MNCKHEILTTTRFKDLIFDSNQGERTVSVYIESCEECGEIFDVYRKI